MTAPEVKERDRTLNIHQRLNTAMAAVPYIKKDKQVDSYMAVTHDNVTAEVRPHFLALGVMVEPTLVTQQTVLTGRETGKKTPIIRFEAVYKVAFVNIDDPKDRVELLVASHADDHGDKAPGKALSYAVKYAILKVLLIETGENDEGRVGNDTGEELNDEEQAILNLLRDASFEGEAALAKAYEALTDKTRLRMVSHMSGLKAAAKAATAKGGAHA